MYLKFVMSKYREKKTRKEKKYWKHYEISEYIEHIQRMELSRRSPTATLVKSEHIIFPQHICEM